MKKEWLVMACVGLLMILVFWGGLEFGKRSCPQLDTVEIKRDTVVDTLFYRHPIPVDSTVIRYQTVKLPAVDTLYLQGSETVRIDSVLVEVPIHQKEYQDSTYHAWVSGFNVSLDSINVYQKTIETVQLVKPAEKTKRWSLGIQLGGGYNFQGGFTPYVGVGVSYNILSW